MALTQATLEELDNALLDLIARAQHARPMTALIFQLMYNTGLRVREVLEVERWEVMDNEHMRVQLEKREGARLIATSDIPTQIASMYENGTPFTLETYSSVNNTFKYYGTGILFGADTRRTTCHAFRYKYIKQLAAEGLNTQQIAARIGHVNLANTARYVSDTIYMFV